MGAECVLCCLGAECVLCCMGAECVLAAAVGSATLTPSMLPSIFELCLGHIAASINAQCCVGILSYSRTNVLTLTCKQCKL